MRKFVGLFLFAAGVASVAFSQRTDTSIVFKPANPDLLKRTEYRPMVNAWGFDLLISNNGFGAGGFWRREISDELSLIISTSISDVKDDAEVERFTPYGQSYVLGKKNRLLHIPLQLSAQYRLFKDDITDNFRPYVTAGLGPSMLFVAPYNKVTVVD
ncbi:MAG: hypothetical protein HY966_05670, partial [Ignavibacteriales bacterium]|nr:hypothetical protein [Ignavibacteriales bacterium]